MTDSRTMYHTITDSALAMRDVVKTFPGRGGPTVQAVRGIDVEIDRGEIVAFLGPNGAGKTTALDMVLGLTRPTAGTIEVFGAEPRRAVSAGRVSAVLQTGGLLRDLSVRETVVMIASTFPRHSPIDEVIDRSGLTAIAKRKVSKCSGGEQQRLRFALALLPDPDLLVLDEPTAGMDVTARREFWDTMRGEADAGRTIIFATHYLQEADAFAERIVMIANGKIVADGSVPQIRAKATGRLITADLPLADRDLVLATLQARSDVADARLAGGRVEIRAVDSDAVARALLVDFGATDLEITAGSLESAFITLTSTTDEASP